MKTLAQSSSSRRNEMAQALVFIAKSYGYSAQVEDASLKLMTLRITGENEGAISLLYWTWDSEIGEDDGFSDIYGAVKVAHYVRFSSSFDDACAKLRRDLENINTHSSALSHLPLSVWVATVAFWAAPFIIWHLA